MIPALLPEPQNWVQEAGMPIFTDNWRHVCHPAVASNKQRPAADLAKRLTYSTSALGRTIAYFQDRR
jgi:hypothetical protein